MVMVVVKEGGKSKAKAADSIASKNIENPKMILGGVKRSDEEKAEMQKAREEAEKKRVAEIEAKKKEIEAKAGDSLTEEEKQKLLEKETLAKENNDLKNQLSEAEQKKKLEAEEKDKEIEKLKAENAELAKNAEGATGSDKPAKVSKKK